MIDFDYSEWAILRFIGASFVLWLCYYLLFDRKAPFNQCRNYLLFSVLLAGAVSVLRIPVYPVEVVKPVKMEHHRQFLYAPYRKSRIYCRSNPLR